MKAYVITTGVLFGLLVVAHVARIVQEGPGIASDPFFLSMTILGAVLCAWAFLVLRTLARRS